MRFKGQKGQTEEDWEDWDKCDWIYTKFNIEINNINGRWVEFTDGLTSKYMKTEINDLPAYKEI